MVTTRPGQPGKIHQHGAAKAEQMPTPGTLAGSQTTDLWLITAPGRHPLWTQYVLACMRLDDVDGLPPAYLRFEGATHEFFVVTLDPRRGPYDRARIAELTSGAGLPHLLPVSVAEQFEATDEEMAELCDQAARGVITGILDPEPCDAPHPICWQWLAFLVKALARIRGEEHAP